VADLIAFSLSGFILKYIGVVNGFRFSFIVAALGGIMYLSLSSATAIVPLLICLCRIGVTMNYNIGYISVPRLFPTKFVTTVYGMVNVIAHLVACTAPLSAEIEDPYPFILFLIAIGFSVFATIYMEEIEPQDSDQVISQTLLEGSFVDVQKGSFGRDNEDQSQFFKKLPNPKFDERGRLLMSSPPKKEAGDSGQDGDQHQEIEEEETNYSSSSYTNNF